MNREVNTIFSHMSKKRNLDAQRIKISLKKNGKHSMRKDREKISQKVTKFIVTGRHKVNKKKHIVC